MTHVQVMKLLFHYRKLLNKYLTIKKLCYNEDVRSNKQQIIGVNEIMATTEQIKGGFAVLQAISEAIREVKKVPSGQLYSQLCDKIDISTYNKIIEILKNSTIIREKNHILYWNVE